jgi:hypothetical protein
MHFRLLSQADEYVMKLKDSTTILITTLPKSRHSSNFLSSYSTCKFLFRVLLCVKSVVINVAFINVISSHYK